MTSNSRGNEIYGSKVICIEERKEKMTSKFSGNKNPGKIKENFRSKTNL